MAPGADPEPAEVPSWTATERGAFMFGCCDRCGFQSPGRRARYSVESDMRAHALLCGPAHLAEDPAESSSPAPAAVDG
ncbi:hypothetical protein [Intrasporangium sp.]|uniref:hypothetical protein n=1 Tax=Intrasporangium sp. TaxID=1925024 RepID=UPI00293B5C9A|nr:hypothetical protein [Intrasporangium sp.]MDV3223273.1 hypothetical protein [Intrasporangium sp.]